VPVGAENQLRRLFPPKQALGGRVPDKQGLFDHFAGEGKLPLPPGVFLKKRGKRARKFPNAVDRLRGTAFDHVDAEIDGAESEAREFPHRPGESGEIVRMHDDENPEFLVQAGCVRFHRAARTRLLYQQPIAREMTRRWISLVPSPICSRR